MQLSSVARHPFKLAAATVLVGLSLGAWWDHQDGGDGAPAIAQRVLGLISSARATGTTSEPPVAHAGAAQTVAVGATAVLDGSASVSPGFERLSYSWTLVTKPAGSTAALSSATAVMPSFTADLAGDYVAQLTVTDWVGTSPAAMVTVSTTNSRPVAAAGRDRAIAAGQIVTLDGTGSTDVDGNGLSYGWTLAEKPAGSAASLSDASAPRPTFTADLAGDYVAELTVSDGTLTSTADRVTLSTNNLAPVANAGPDRKGTVDVKTRVDHDGTSDANGDRVKVRWSLAARPDSSYVSFYDRKGRRAKLKPDVAGTYVLQLRVKDGAATVYDTVVISTGNTRPVADAGRDAAIAAGAQVTLDGGASSDVDGDMLSYRWALIRTPAGSAAALDDASQLRPRFTADLAGTYVAQLIVADASLSSHPDTVVVTTSNVAPAAKAGADQSIAWAGYEGVSVAFDGTGSSDADGDALTYRWAVVSTARTDDGTTVLDDPASATPTVSIPRDWDYYDYYYFEVWLPNNVPWEYFGYWDGADITLVQLVVSDGATESAPDTMLISAKNSRPVANAGPDQQVDPNTLIQLDGAGSSDFDGTALTYQWAFLRKPAGSAATLSDPTAASPTFTADIGGAYVVQLIVKDDKLRSRPDTVVIDTGNEPPVADAGADKTVFVGATAQLDGSASSDPDGDPLTYVWTFASRPAGSAATLSNATTTTPSFTPDKTGAYVLQLVVNDGQQSSPPDTVTVTAPNRAPVASAGPDQTVTFGATVQLDGTASADPDGDALTYAWSIAQRPTGSTAAIVNPTSATPTFVADGFGLFSIELKVSDGTVESTADMMTVLVPAAGNQPPMLGAVGDKTVALGSTLSFTLTGSDPDGDPISFGALPVPLPAGASLDGQTGIFTFTPSLAQVGAIPLTFTVSDGMASDTEAVTITVTGPPAGRVTAFTGRILDANDFAGGVTTPIVGATVTFLNSGVTATTDLNGDFVLSGLPAGATIFDIDASTAAPGPGGAAYAGFREEQSVIADVNNVVERPFFLPRIEALSLTTVDPATTTIVENTRLGVRLVIPPATAKNPDGTNFTGQMSISEVPRGLAPAELPDFLDPGLLITIQPVGVTFATPLAITFPNIDNGPAGDLIYVWSLDPASGKFIPVALNQIAAGGASSDTISGGIRAATWHAPFPPRPNPEGGPDNPEDQQGDPEQCTECQGQSSISIAAGNLSETHRLAGYRSLGRSRSLQLRYSSTTADPQPTVSTEPTILRIGGVPSTVSNRISVGSIARGAQAFTSTASPAPLDESKNEKLRHVVQFDARALSTGAHKYRLRTTNNYASSRLSTDISRSVLVITG